MWPACTVYYRHCPAGTPVLLGFPTPILSSSHSFRFGLTKAGGTKERPVLFSKGQSRGANTAWRDFQLLNQNSDVFLSFYLSYTSLGLFPQP